MKNSIVCIPLLVACLLGSLSAAIPQLINYQGLLLDDNGTKVTGIKAITLKVFTGATDGNGTKEIYDENVGNVSITDGLYAFNFGGTGLSVITTTETVGEGNASAQIYNYTVLHPPVLADSASIVKSDVNGSALATWSQTGGSDDPSFISSVVNSSGAVSVTNASGAPATGEKIKITYDYNSVGIMGALASNPNAWLEVSVDGSPLLPRQRLVAVPFANVAGTIQGENLSVDPVSGNVIVKNNIVKPDGASFSSLKPWELLQRNIVYFAETDGFVYIDAADNDGQGPNPTGGTIPTMWFQLGDTDSSLSNFLYLRTDRYDYNYFYHIPVPKGKFWKVSNNGSGVRVRWIAFN
jgi:hypothetical protein